MAQLLPRHSFFFHVIEINRGPFARKSTLMMYQRYLFLIGGLFFFAKNSTSSRLCRKLANSRISHILSLSIPY